MLLSKFAANDTQTALSKYHVLKFYLSLSDAINLFENAIRKKSNIECIT